VKAISRPEGLQAGLVSIPLEVVSRRRLEPSRWQTKISMLAPSARVNAIRRPSGENAGEALSDPSVASGVLRPLAMSAR
jgi:hypothetical protein